MNSAINKYRSYLVNAVPWLILVLILGYTYVWFVAVPYAGFRFEGRQSTVVSIYLAPENAVLLQVGDHLLKVGDVNLEVFRANPYQTLFDGVAANDIVPITLERDSAIITIDWNFPGFTQTEFTQRLISQWWLTYVFWIIGTLSFLLIRPRKMLWRLLVAFNYLTAIWLSAGVGPSAQHYAGSLIVLRSSMWLSVPVLLHLHWIFPTPLRKTPRIVSVILYSFAILMAMAEIFNMLPLGIYQYVYALALLVSMLLLAVHAFIDKSNRQTLRILFLGALFSIVPLLVLSNTTLNNDSTRSTLLFSILTFPVLPAAYFYAASRRQLGGLETRANRVISVYLFIIILGTALLMIVPTIISALNESSSLVVASLISSLVTAIIVLATFERFERFVEQHILNIPTPPTQLFQDFSEKITTSLSIHALANLIQENILPSLLIRQSAIILLDDLKITHIPVQAGIESSLLPKSEDIPVLLETKGELRITTEDSHAEEFYPWIRLVLPLRSGEKLIGLWVFGSRDPEDYYSQKEIGMLRSLANQAAIALTNISQAERLRALYKSNIERHEGERKRLAHDLHDVVLNKLAAIYSFVSDDEIASEIQAQHQEITNHLRQIIQDLRPSMLDFGLSKALEELTDNLSKQSGNGIQFSMDISIEDCRFDSDIELHIFRIIQQAYENSLRHADAKNVALTGILETNHISLSVNDDGRGFSINSYPDVIGLLETQHFGIAGMSERAALINAQFSINSLPDKGTTVNIEWRQS